MDPIFEAYKQILRESIDLTNHKPKYSREDRQAKLLKLAYKKIQDYIDNGSRGDLDLSNTQITSLPDNLEVGGHLYLYKTPITSLPDNLNVGGGLNIRNTPITSLPDNLKVGGVIYLRNTPISKKYATEELERMLPGVRGNIKY